MPPRNAEEREALEYRLATLRELRVEKVQARRRTRLLILAISGVAAVAVGAGLWLTQAKAGGMSARSPLYWLVGLLGLAAIPAALFIMRPKTSDSDDEAADLDLASLDVVIRRVEKDLTRSVGLPEVAPVSLAERSARASLDNPELDEY